MQKREVGSRKGMLLVDLTLETLRGQELCQKEILLF